MPDTPIPLAAPSDFETGPFSDLVSQINTTYPGFLAIACAEATREVEGFCHRRLAPFTGLTETVRLTGLSPDERAQSGPGAHGWSAPYDVSLTPPQRDRVRVARLPQRPPHYPEMWTWAGTPSFTTAGPVAYSSFTILGGPDDQGRVYLLPADFIPTGQRVHATYGGGTGYTTVPADLVRAAKYLVAAICVRELNPDTVSHDPDALWRTGMGILVNGRWVRA